MATVIDRYLPKAQGHQIPLDETYGDNLVYFHRAIQRVKEIKGGGTGGQVEKQNRVQYIPQICHFEFS